MSVRFDPRKRIYDLYSFDAPYDLEWTEPTQVLQDYAGDLATDKHSAAAVEDEQENQLEGLDLTLEEAEPGHRFLTSGFRLVSEQNRTSGLPPFYVPVVMRVYHTYSPCLEEGGA